MVIYIPLIVSVVGLLMYALSKDAKVSQIGRDMFWVGLLAFLLGYSGHGVVLSK
jgi:Na+/phosphate symporter